MAARIVGGSARGRRIAVPHNGVRPTSDRVREALMSSIESRLAAAGLEWPQVRVLDLFAGSGALGLEALSRGACEVVLVERDPAAASVAEANAADLMGSCAGAARVVRADAQSFLRRDPGGFDLVLADPPYAMADDAVLAIVHGAAAASPGALIVVERRSGAPSPLCPHVAGPAERRYGDTALWYGRAAEDADEG